MSTDDVNLVHIVKSRLDGSQLLSHLTSRLRAYETRLGSAELEVSRLLDGMTENTIALRDASALFKAKASVVAVTIALRACDREIRAQRAELRELDQLIDTNRAMRGGRRS